MKQQPDDTGSGAPAGAGETQQGSSRPGGRDAAGPAAASEKAKSADRQRPRADRTAAAAASGAEGGDLDAAARKATPNAAPAASAAPGSSDGDEGAANAAPPCETAAHKAPGRDDADASAAAAQRSGDEAEGSDANATGRTPTDPADVADAAGAAAQARISELEDQIGQLGDDLAQARADHYNLKREYSGFVRRQKDEGARSRELGRRDVLQALLSVLDDIDAARKHDDLTGPFKAIAEKLEGALEKGFDLHRYGAAGDEFDPALHDALLAQDSSEVKVATVAQVIQPGYRSGETVLRPTKVMVNNPA